MGNENSTTTKKNLKTKTKPVPKKPRVQGSVYPNYQVPVSSLAYLNSPMSTEKNPITNDKNYYYLQTPLKNKVPEESARSSSSQNNPPNQQSKQPISAPLVQPSSSITNKEHSYPVLLDKPLTAIPNTEQSSSVSLQKTSNEKILTPIVIKQQIVLPSTKVYPPSQNIFNNFSLPHTATANSFEKAPKISLNYIVKPSNDDSTQIYGPGKLTVIHRPSLQSTTYGHRWYDNNYTKPEKPMVIENL